MWMVGMRGRSSETYCWRPVLRPRRHIGVLRRTLDTLAAFRPLQRHLRLLGRSWRSRSHLVVVVYGVISTGFTGT